MFCYAFTQFFKHVLVSSSTCIQVGNFRRGHLMCSSLLALSWASSCSTQLIEYGPQSLDLRSSGCDLLSSGYSPQGTNVMVCSPFIWYYGGPWADVLLDLIGSSVFLLLSATSTMKAFLVPLSTPPKTQCPSTTLPRLYFLLPNFDSSILPGPPIVTGWSIKYWLHTSLQKLYQSTTTRWETFTVFDTWSLTDHRYISFRIVQRGSLLMLKKLPSLTLFTAWHPFMGHLQKKVPFLQNASYMS